MFPLNGIGRTMNKADESYVAIVVLLCAEVLPLPWFL
jgi:hypothetical protein